MPPTNVKQIGKTSSLAMTLCGVLKDILLVVTSMIIFLDLVKPMQAFGYSIALAGLVYYRIGGEQLKEYASQGQRAWADYGMRHPGARRAIAGVGIILLLVLTAVTIHSSGVLPREYYDSAQSRINEYLAKGDQP